MVSNNVRLVSLVAIFINALTGFGSALRIITEPHPFNDTTGELRVTCLVDGATSLEKTIVDIQMVKEGLAAPIISINNVRGLTFGLGKKKNMKAEGIIGNNASQSFLTLTIENPQFQDAGTYRCQMFFFNEEFKMNKEYEIGNVIFEGQDTTDLVISLLKKVSNLAKTVRDQGDVNSNQKNETLRLEEQFEALTNLINKQNETIHRLEAQLELQGKWMNKKVCPDEWKYYKADQTCLKVFGEDDDSKQLSWFKSREACQTFDGDLVQIRDEEKSSFVNDMFGNSSVWPWIGVRNVAEVGFDFRYVDGSSVDAYHPWHPGKPERADGDNVSCVYMSAARLYNREWGNFYCSVTSPYVCSITSHTTGVL